jgi:CRISPR/Cas system CSM-associated protein Csm3 (group 7 of RAMP superfamily)
VYVLQFIQESHKHVSRCYDLDAEGAFDRATPESRAFIMERCRAGAQFTMDLWYHAWLRSATMPKHY